MTTTLTVGLGYPPGPVACRTRTAIFVHRPNIPADMEGGVAVAEALHAVVRGDIPLSKYFLDIRQ